MRADLVTYGKTLGGGLPIGVLCGTREYMKRFRDDRPADVCFARGTFNSHPYVMATMNEFLRGSMSREIQRDVRRPRRALERARRALNARLAAAGAPVRVANMASVWTVLLHQPSRYNWMFQYYLRAEGLALSWVGTGRLILSHELHGRGFRRGRRALRRAARNDARDGWWWTPAHATNKSVRRTILSELSGEVRRRPRRRLRHRRSVTERPELPLFLVGSLRAASGSPSCTCSIGSISSPRSRCSGARSRASCRGTGR